jgi:hypothetical protein
MHATPRTFTFYSVVYSWEKRRLLTFPGTRFNPNCLFRERIE